MGSYYDSEVERQKKGATTVNTILPILAALETIATAKATRGQNVGTSTLGLIKDAHSRRADALERAQKSDKDAFTKNLHIGEAARASKRYTLDEAQGKREASRYDREIQDAGEKENTRKMAIDRLLGIPNEYDEKTNTVTRSGMPGVPNLSIEDKTAIQLDPVGWLSNKLKPQATQLVLGSDGTYQALNKATALTPEGNKVAAPPPKEPKASKTLEEIEAEAKARAEGAAAGAAGKPLSGDAAKLSGYVQTALDQGAGLKNLIKTKGIRWVTGQYKLGNPAVVNVIEDVADAKGRLRSGGAVNDQEANRFKQPFSGLGNVFYGDDKAALAAIDQVLAEATTVQEGMKGGKAPAIAEGTERVNKQGVKMRMTGGKWQPVQ